MIRAAGNANGRPFALVGLSHENIARLFANEPIVVDLAAEPPDGMGIEGAPRLFIIAGTTEEAMVSQLRAAGLTPDET